MEKQLKVAAIHDLSGFGRCSLNIAIPILSAMGIRCCPVPTAILSNHTEFAEGYFFRDLTDIIDRYLDKWQDMGLSFDAVYSGFLGSVRQIELVAGFKDRFPSRLIVDPVMGDLGQVYNTFDDDFCSKMRRLIARADLITPNLTEASILTQREYHGEKVTADHALELAKDLAAMGPNQIVITGILDGDQIINLTYQKDSDDCHLQKIQRVPSQYNGTGDAFTTVLCGHMVKGLPLHLAVAKAADFIYRAALYSYNNGVDPVDGIAFEPLLQSI